jgi:ribosomal protein L17
MILSLFKWFQSVDSILADFQNKVDDLEEISDVLEKRANQQREYAAKLMTRAKEHESEAKRATRIASKIQEFLV